MRNASLLALALCGLGGASIATTPAHAYEYPWCAQYAQYRVPTVRYAQAASTVIRDTAQMPRLADDGGGGRNCGFMTLEQCRAALAGAGGTCEPNPFYRGPEPAPSRRPRR
jgi:Protein of unknown function (DUF3551)